MRVVLRELVLASFVVVLTHCGGDETSSTGGATGGAGATGDGGASAGGAAPGGNRASGGSGPSTGGRATGGGSGSAGNAGTGATANGGNSGSGSAAGAGGSSGSAGRDGGTLDASSPDACSALSTDASAFDKTCVNTIDCPGGYTCQPFNGIVLSYSCQVLCQRDCECPAGRTCQAVSDESGASWKQCNPP
jgi:hypothetical protein